MFTHRLIRTVTVVMALGAVAAPTAAAVPVDDRSGVTADNRDAGVPRGIYQPIRPEDQPQPPQDLRSPDTVDIASGRAIHNSSRQDLRSPDTVDVANGRAIHDSSRQDLRSPDAVDVANGRAIHDSSPQDLRSPDTADVADGRGAPTSPEVVVVRLPEPGSAPVSASGIDWADAGLGAGSLLGIVLIGLGGALFILHRRATRRLAS
jgi:hypothetical protein